MGEPDAVDELFAELEPSTSDSEEKSHPIKTEFESETVVSEEVAVISTVNTSNGEETASRKLLARAFDIELWARSDITVSSENQHQIDKMLSDVAYLLKNGEKDESNKSDLWLFSSRGDENNAGATVNKPMFKSAFDMPVSESTSFTDLKQTDESARPERQLSCFNCEGSHNVSECPEPKDMARIRKNRYLFQQKTGGTPNGRYHKEKDARFNKYTPGEISPALREALSLRLDEVPPWIYEMRVLGYPPGYFRLLSQPPAKLVIYNEQNTGKEVEEELDSSNFVEYPGFNVPLPLGVHDEYKEIGCPPMLHHHRKDNFLAYVTSVTGKRIATNGAQPAAVKGERKSSEMDIEVDDQGPSVTEAILNNSSGSSTMEALEEKRLKIMEELRAVEMDVEEPPSKRQRGDSSCKEHSAPASPEAAEETSEVGNEESATVPKRIPLGDTSGEDMAMAPSTSSQPSPGTMLSRSLSMDRGTPIHGTCRSGTKPQLEQFASGITPFEPHEESPVKPGCGGYKMLKKLLKRKK